MDTNNNPSPEQTEPLGPPEIGKTPQRTVPQLVRSTKPTKIELTEPPEQEVETENEEVEAPVLEPADDKPVPKSFVAPATQNPRREPTEEELNALNEHWEDPGDPDGVHEQEQEQKWREVHPTPSATPQATSKKKRRWPVALLVIVLLAAATVGAYWFGNKKAAAPTVPAATSSKKATLSTKPQAQTTPTKQYSSTNFTLAFSYPGTWKVTDTASKLTVVSPSVQLMTADGKQASEHVLVTIQNQQTNITGYPVSGALASLASDKVTYKQPTAIQRAQTYVSYVGYSKANGLDAIFVTGDIGYQQGQQVPMSDIIKGNPLISVTFDTCASDDCSTGATTPVTLLASSWKSTSASKDITSLLESIQLN